MMHGEQTLIFAKPTQLIQICELNLMKLSELRSEVVQRYYELSKRSISQNISTNSNLRIKFDEIE